MTDFIIADDLFAGAGGWDLGAQALGIRARGVENMPEARATRDAAGLITIHDDVWTYEPDGKATLGIASPPCQTFSQAGSGSGRKALSDVLAVIASGDYYDRARLQARGRKFGDDRTALVLAPLFFAVTGNYRALAWEQVPTVLPVWQACAEVLRSLGWNVWTGMLHAEQYGVPQTRKRAVLLASLDRDVTPPKPTHSRYHSRTPERLDEGVEKWVSMARALNYGMTNRPAPTVTGGGTETGGAEPIAHLDRYVNRDDWQAREWQLSTGTRPRSATRLLDQPAPTLAFGHDAASYVWSPAGMTPAELVDYKAKFTQQSDNEPDYSWPFNRPSTVVAGRDLVQAPGATANRFNGSTKSRNDGIRITVAEAGVLQTFPRDFPWQGKATRLQYLQAGNAVPPLLAMHALRAVAR